MKGYFLLISLIIIAKAPAQNVGIGTATPQQKLEVAGNVSIRDSLGIGFPAPHAPLQFANIAANRKIVLYENLNTDHQFYGFGVNGSTLRYQTDQPGSDHVFYAATSATTSNELMRIRGNGNVGIGTSTPGYKLDVAGTSRITGDFSLINNDIGGTWFYLTNTSGSPTGWKMITSGTATPGGPGKLMFFNVSNNSALTILQNGNMGVGVDAPSVKLDVSGSLKVDGDVSITGKIGMGYVQVYKDVDYLGNTVGSTTLDCPAGTKVMGGGGGLLANAPEAQDIVLNYSGPDPNNPSSRWKFYVTNKSSGTKTVRYYCICAAFQ